MPGHQVTEFWRKLFGQRGTSSSPAEAWVRRRRDASPEEVLRQYLEATVAHDLEWLLATMAPERARLYSDPRTLDRRRVSVVGARLLSAEPAPDAVPLPEFAARYKSAAVFRVEFELDLAPPEERRDPSVREGRQWSYFVLVKEKPGAPWLIADWGL